MSSIEKYIQMLEASRETAPHPASNDRLNHSGQSAHESSEPSSPLSGEKVHMGPEQFFSTFDNAKGKVGRDVNQLTYNEKPPSASKRKLKFPLNRKGVLGLISPDQAKSQVAEEFRAIKLPLLAHISARETGNSLANVIMVTSCVEGEGKTFSAINLSMSLAMERNKTVLLIDADVMKSATSAMLGISVGEPGLIDVLLEDTRDISGVLWDTQLENLKCIPAGTKSDHASELLGSTAMLELIQQLSNRYPDRIIVLDTPPILLTSEAMVLANQVGQIVFVVSAEHTTQGMVADAIGRLPSSAHVGMLLNKSKKKIGATYGYGYGYGYGH